MFNWSRFIFVFILCLLGSNALYARIAKADKNNQETIEKKIAQEHKDVLSNLKKRYNYNVTINKKGDGYHGVWSAANKTPGEYVYKYAGGLGTYSAKHRPFAIYSDEADKTFFCYGGSKELDNRALMHMVSYYDHKTGMVPRPTILLDKETIDAHDNPVISIDDKGYIWIFSTSHGVLRPSYIHKSKKPYCIDQFELIAPTRDTKNGTEPFLNFSYFQVWNVKDKGFGCFMTVYDHPYLVGQPARRNIYFISSEDGVSWEIPTNIAAMDYGSYQISFANSSKAATAFNYHPFEGSIDRRANIYYVETLDFGKTWQNAAGEKVDLPLTDPQNSALVYESESKDRTVYLKDIAFDKNGNPVILVISGGGWQCGPRNGPRTWLVVHFDGNKWQINPAFDSDNNYDTGSIFVQNNVWRIIGPSAVGPQAYNPGGEIIMWESKNQGQTWNRVKQLTVNSPRNHNYVRGVVNARPDFYALWADGNGRQESMSNLYFCDQQGNVYMLPRKMDKDFQKPVKIELGTID